MPPPDIERRTVVPLPIVGTSVTMGLTGGHWQGARMDVWHITVVVLRRWYVFIPLLALTVVSMLTAAGTMRPEYDVNSSVLLIPGTGVSEVPDPFGGGTQAVAAVGVVLNSPETKRQLVEDGLSAEFQVASQARSNIMSISVRASSAEIGLATADELYQRASEEVAGRLSAAGVPREAQYRFDYLAHPAVTDVVYDGKDRVMAVVGALGAALSLLITVLFDDIVGYSRRWLHRRRNRRGGHLDAAQSDPDLGNTRKESDASAGKLGGNDAFHEKRDRASV